MSDKPSILDVMNENEPKEKAEEFETIDPNLMLIQMLEVSSQIQMSLINLTTRLDALEHHAAYLLSKDPGYMEALKKAQEEQNKAKDGNSDGPKQE